MRPLLVLAALLIAIVSSACGKSASEPEANVVFTSWSQWGSNGAIGSVKNTGGALASRVTVRTSTSYEAVETRTSPSEIPPGGTATFYGAGSGPGVIARPTIEWIKWD